MNRRAVVSPRKTYGLHFRSRRGTPPRLRRRSRPAHGACPLRRRQGPQCRVPIELPMRPGGDLGFDSVERPLASTQANPLLDVSRPTSVDAAICWADTRSRAPACGATSRSRACSTTHRSARESNPVCAGLRATTSTSMPTFSPCSTMALYRRSGRIALAQIVSAVPADKGESSVRESWAGQPRAYAGQQTWPQRFPLRTDSEGPFPARRYSQRAGVNLTAAVPTSGNLAGC